MRYTIGLKICIAFATVYLSPELANAQDTSRKVPVASSAAKQPATANKPAITSAKPPVAAPKLDANSIPINPKTGRPYTKWGYGTHAKAYQEQKADSAQKAATATAQPATAVVADKSLNGQYQTLLNKVYNYQQPFVAAFWKNVRDSLNNGRQQLKAANDKLNANAEFIAQLQNNVNSHEDQLSQADSINFLGISFSKNGYSAMMWGLVIVLGAVATIIFLRSGSARSEATYRIKLYNELEEEYKAYKTKANEKEKKLARELQTERNKIDELMGRG